MSVDEYVSRRASLLARLGGTYEQAADSWLLHADGLLRFCREITVSRDVDLLHALSRSRLLETLDGEAFPQESVRDRARLLLTVTAQAMAGMPPPADAGGLHHQLYQLIRQPTEPVVLASTDTVFLLSDRISGSAAVLRLRAVTRQDSNAGGSGEGASTLEPLRPDLAVAPFQFVDHEFQLALQRAWKLAHVTPPVSPLPAFDVRWSIHSVDTGRPLGAVRGRSVALAAAVGFRQLSDPVGAPSIYRYAYTGDIDDNGDVVSLLGPLADVRQYRLKLERAGARTVFLPAADFAAVSSLPVVVEGRVAVRPVAKVEDGLALSRRPPPWWARWSGEDFVGRVEPLSAIRDAWVEAKSGQRVLIVRGEHGIGKTRLLAEAARQLDRLGALTLYGSCSAGAVAGIETAPFVEAFAAYVEDTPESTLRMQLGEQVDDVARWFPALATRLGVAAPRPVASLSDAFAMLVMALRRWIGAIGASGPITIVLDDLQWATPRTWALVNALARSPQELPLLIVAIVADGPDNDRLAPTINAILRLRDAGVVNLPGLTLEDATNLVHKRRPTGPAASSPSAPAEPAGNAAALAARLWEEAGGNALYLVELITAATAGITGPSGAQEIVLPPHLDAALAVRIGLLGNDARELLAMGAVAGRSFTLGLVAAALGWEESRAMRAVEEAFHHHLLAEVPGRADQLVFRHGLMHRAALSDISTPRRRRLHRDLARVLERPDGPGLRSGVGAAELLDELAHHWAEAAPLDAEAAARAVSAATAAAQAATARYAYESAERNLLVALDALGAAPPPVERAQLLIELGEVRNRAGAPERGRTVFAEAADLAELAGDWRLLARASIGFGGQIPVTGEDRDAVALLQRARVRLAGGPPCPELALVLGRLAHWQFTASAAEKRRLIDEALAVAGAVGDESVRATVQNERYWALYGPNDSAARLNAAEEIVAIGRRLADPAVELQGAQCRVHVLHELGRAGLEAAISHRDHLASRLRLPHFLWTSAVTAALQRALAGNFAQAAELAVRARDDYQDTDRQQANVVHGAQMTMINWLWGRLGEQRSPADRSRDRDPARALWRAWSAWIAAEVDDLDECRFLLDLLIEGGYRDIRPNFEFWSMLVCYSAAAVAVNDQEAAARLHRRLQPYASRFCMVGQSANYGVAALHLGRLATTLGDIDQAERWFRRAEVSHRRLGSPPLLALTEGYHALALADSDPRRAARLAADAQRVAEGLGMQRLQAILAPRFG